MPFTASAGQQAATPINNGVGALSSSQPLSSSATTHAGWDITGVGAIGVSIKKFGTLTGDCTLSLQISFDGSTFLTFKNYTNAQIADANGIADFVQVKALQARFVLTLGTLTGSNGVTTRLMI